MGFGRLWVQLDGLAKARLGVSHPPGGKQQASQIVANRGRAWLPPQRFLEAGDRFGHAPHQAQRRAQVVMEFGRGRMQMRGPGQMVDGSGGLTLSQRHQPQKMMRVRVVRFPFQHLYVEPFSFGEFSCLMMAQGDLQGGCRSGHKVKPASGRPAAGSNNKKAPGVPGLFVIGLARYQTAPSRLERRGQDSNLRTSFPVTDLANRRFRPLSHLSGSWHTPRQTAHAGGRGQSRAWCNSARQLVNSYLFYW